MLIIISGFVQAEIAPGAAVTGMIAAFAWAFTQEYLLRGLVVAEMRRISRRARWTFIMSALLSTIWMIPIAITAASSSRILVLILLGPLLTCLTAGMHVVCSRTWVPLVGPVHSAFFRAHLAAQLAESARDYLHRIGDGAGRFSEFFRITHN